MVKLPDIEPLVTAPILAVPLEFEINVKGIGVFPHLNHIRAIWIGMDSEELALLTRKINEQLNYIRREQREEIPHLTVARMKTARNKDKVREVLQKVENEDFGSMLVDKVVLYESELTPEGPVYSVLEEFKLG